MTKATSPALQPDFFAQLAATDPYQIRARRLFERGQVVAVNGNQADVLVGYRADGGPLELKQVPIVSGYVPRTGDWVSIQYEAGHSGAPWITGPSMAADDSRDSAGIGVFSVSDVEPDSPQSSLVYFDDDRRTWRGWDGAAWVDFASRLHNDLPDLQGGGSGAYYHLGPDEHGALTDENAQLEALHSDGAPTFAGATFTKQYHAAYHNNGDSGAAKTINWGNGNVQQLRTTAHCTLTFSNPQSGGRYLLVLVRTGAHSVTWPAAVKWAGGNAPTLSGNGKVDVITFVYAGAYYFAGCSLEY